MDSNQRQEITSGNKATKTRQCGGSDDRSIHGEQSTSDDKRYTVCMRGEIHMKRLAGFLRGNGRKKSEVCRVRYTSGCAWEERMVGH